MLRLHHRLLPLLFLAVAYAGAGCFFGGDDKPASVSRPGAIPTATAPASLPEPMLLGETQPGTAPQASPTSEQTYVLKSGDTLLAVATQLGIPDAQQAAWVAEVLRLNGIADARLLQSGQTLRLPRVQATPRPTGTVQPTATARTPTPSGAAAASPTPRPTLIPGSGGSYTVVSGDYPLLIAEKLGVPAAQQLDWAAQLVALNNVNPSGLQVGQVLRLPSGTPAGGVTGTPTPSSSPAPTATPTRTP